MIFFILQLLIPKSAEDVSELMGLDMYILAPIFLVLGIVCMICWLKDRRTTKKNGRKLIEKIEEIENNNIDNIFRGW